MCRDSQDYDAIIEKPMDLGTIRSRLEGGSYSHPLEFLADCRLVFSNAQIYNKKGSDIFVMAETLSAKFEERWSHLIVPKVQRPFFPVPSTHLCERAISRLL